MRKTIVIALIATFAGALAPAADVTAVSYETTDLIDKQKQTGNMYFGENRLKIVTAAQQQTPATEVIYRADRQLVWIVDHQKKSYVQMDRETMQQMSDRFAGMYQQLEAQLAQLPPEQRAQAERMLKGRLPQSPPQQAHGELKQTSERREVNGYPCVKYEFYLNGELDTELWVTKGSQLNFSEMSELLRSMGEFYSGLTKNLPGGAQSVDFDFQAFSDLDGFPILIRNIGSGRATSETLIRQIRSEQVPSGFFDPPSGYKAVNPMEGPGR